MSSNFYVIILFAFKETYDFLHLDILLKIAIIKISLHIVSNKSKTKKNITQNFDMRESREVST